MYRYYAVERPVSLGAVPRGFESFENYEKKKDIERIGMKAHGEVFYKEPLQIEDLIRYELIYGGEV